MLASFLSGCAWSNAQFVKNEPCRLPCEAVTHELTNYILEGGMCTCMGTVTTVRFQEPLSAMESLAKRAEKIAAEPCKEAR